MGASRMIVSWHALYFYGIISHIAWSLTMKCGIKIWLFWRKTHDSNRLTCISDICDELSSFFERQVFQNWIIVFFLIRPWVLPQSCANLYTEQSPLVPSITTTSYSWCQLCGGTSERSSPSTVTMLMCCLKKWIRLAIVCPSCPPTSLSHSQSIKYYGNIASAWLTEHSWKGKTLHIQAWTKMANTLQTAISSRFYWIKIFACECHFIEINLLGYHWQSFIKFIIWTNDREWMGLWGFLWWAPLAKRKDHHGVSSGWSSVWHHSNTGLSSTQY